ncbi:MAG: signal peptide peptidase SppA [Bacteroidia bacterium]
MKQFFKITFASMLGFVLGLFILIILFSIIIGAIAGSKKSTKAEIKPNSILELDLSYDIPERSGNNMFSSGFSGFGSTTIGLNDIILNIKKAAENDNIKGIKLTCGLWPSDYATLNEIRNELIAFKTNSGKFIIAYGEFMDEHSYYVASVADKIYLNPAGQILLNGFSSQVIYLKNMLDKIGVEPQLIRHGKYKSAGEPFITDKMSSENRQQIETYLGNLYGYFVSQIAASRGINENTLKDIIENLKTQNNLDAIKLGIIDSVKYADEVEAELKTACGIKPEEDLSVVSLKTFNNIPNPKTSVSDNKIAVLYCSGEIMNGKGNDEIIGSDKIAEIIKQIRTKNKYKALVVRINSPGGSSLASDVIWREISLAKQKIPVVVSMGAVAASGGYYIAAPANKIFAQPNTITGSIGVFGLLINAKNLLNNKLGINIETVKFGKYADIGMPDRALTADEKAILQNEVDKVYDDFISNVAAGRNLTKQQVDELAQGRVYSGIEAKKLGLIDEFGGLNDAVKYAAELAKLEDYRTVNLPEQKEPFEELLSILTDDAQAKFSKFALGEEYYNLYNQLNKIKHLQGIQAKMPFELKIE